MLQVVGHAALNLRISIVLLIGIHGLLLHLWLNKLTRILEKVLTAAVYASTAAILLSVRKVSKAGRGECLPSGLLLQLLLLLQLGCILTA